MTNKLKKQVEVQGTKKLGSVKNVQELSLNEMKQIEGGIHPALVFIAGAIAGGMIYDFACGFAEGLWEGMKK